MKLTTNNFTNLNLVQKIMVEEGNVTPIRELLNTEMDDQSYSFKPIGYGIIEGVKGKGTKKEEDFTVLLVQQEDGIIFSVGSESFRENFIRYFETLENVEEDWYIEAYTGESKNYTGKVFVSCRLKDGKLPK